MTKYIFTLLIFICCFNSELSANSKGQDETQRRQERDAKQDNCNEKLLKQSKSLSRSGNYKEAYGTLRAAFGSTLPHPSNEAYFEQLQKLQEKSQGLEQIVTRLPTTVLTGDNFITYCLVESVQLVDWHTDTPKFMLTYGCVNRLVTPLRKTYRAHFYLLNGNNAPYVGITSENRTDLITHIELVPNSNRVLVFNDSGKIALRDFLGNELSVIDRTLVNQDSFQKPRLLWFENKSSAIDLNTGQIIFIQDDKLSTAMTEATNDFMKSVVFGPSILLYKLYAVNDRIDFKQISILDGKVEVQNFHIAYTNAANQGMQVVPLGSLNHFILRTEGVVKEPEESTQIKYYLLHRKPNEAPTIENLNDKYKNDRSISIKTDPTNSADFYIVMRDHEGEFLTLEYVRPTGETITIKQIPGFATFDAEIFPGGGYILERLKLVDPSLQEREAASVQSNSYWRILNSDFDTISQVTSSTLPDLLLKSYTSIRMNGPLPQFISSKTAVESGRNASSIFYFSLDEEKKPTVQVASTPHRDGYGPHLRFCPGKGICIYNGNLVSLANEAEHKVATETDFEDYTHDWHSAPDGSVTYSYQLQALPLNLESYSTTFWDWHNAHNYQFILLFIYKRIM